jgi:quinol monooxygenase YgiN
MTYGLLVRFETKADGHRRFVDLVQENARTSVAREAGCLRFDVLLSAGNEIFLYEIYRDEAAFADHLASAHFKSFDAGTRDLIVSKQVTTGTLTQNAKAPEHQ